MRPLLPAVATGTIVRVGSNNLPAAGAAPAPAQHKPIRRDTGQEVGVLVIDMLLEAAQVPAPVITLGGWAAGEPTDHPWPISRGQSSPAAPAVPRAPEGRLGGAGRPTGADRRGRVDRAQRRGSRPRGRANPEPGEGGTQASVSRWWRGGQRGRGGGTLAASTSAPQHPRGPVRG